MRVIVYETVMMLDVSLLCESNLEEIGRIAVMSQASELYKFRKIADTVVDRYDVGVSFANKAGNKASAYASFYFDFSEDVDGVYFKLAAADLISNNHT